LHRDPARQAAFIQNQVNDPPVRAAQPTHAPSALGPFCREPNDARKALDAIVRSLTA